MFDKIEFIPVPGTKKERKITLLGLSTCGFCKRGLSYLSENNLEHRYIFMDKIAPVLKDKIIKEFKAKFNERPRYPTLILDDEEYEIGFNPSSWAQRLGLES